MHWKFCFILHSCVLKANHRKGLKEEKRQLSSYIYFYFTRCPFFAVNQQLYFNHCHVEKNKTNIRSHYLIISPVNEVQGRVYRKHSVCKSVCPSVCAGSCPALLCFDIGLSYLARVYYHEPEGQIYRDFDKALCSGHSLFMLWHSHTIIVTKMYHNGTHIFRTSLWSDLWLHHQIYYFTMNL